VRVLHAIVMGRTIKKYFSGKSVLMINEEAEGLVPCGIPYIFYLLGNDADKNKMGPKPFLDLGDGVIINSVSEADKNNKQVQLKTGEKIGYDKLVFATGSLPIVPASIRSNNLKNVFYIKKSYAYIHELTMKLSTFNNIVIVGGGFIGAEVAEQLAAGNAKVTLIESEPLCFSKAFSPELCSIATNALKNSNVNVMTSTLVKELIGEKDAVKQVLLSDGSKIEADAVILSIGYKANSQLAKDAGFELNKYDDIHVDNYGRTTVKDISAVGDCAQTFGFLTGRSDVIKLASTATAEARVLGHNIFGIRIKKSSAGTLGVFSAKINRMAMAAAGANEINAKEACVEFVSSKFSSPDRHPGALPGMSDLTVKLYASSVNNPIIRAAGDIVFKISYAG
jgi:NADH oxidase (H2O2-forming)